MVGITQVSELKNATGSNPIAVRIRLPMPSWKSRIHRNTSAATTLETRNGVSTSERSRVDWVSRCIRTAISRASTVWNPMLRIT
ncbi:hypothetical protein [Sanguibacter sp. Z1732]|uniref:hypothetical protein n=1 Tax=Sanguibacter sp. Z1732 TaxID=3435412 RepID=UPI003D9CA5C0